MKKGISIMALSIYIAGFITIMGIMIAFNINIFGKINDFVTKNTINTEYIKFNMFLTTLVKDNNYIEIDSQDNIVISKYEYNLIPEINEEEIVVGGHFEKSNEETIGKIVYDRLYKQIKYFKYNTNTGDYEINPVIMSNYVEQFEYSVSDNNKITINNLAYKLKKVEIEQLPITHLMGRGY